MSKAATVFSKASVGLYQRAHELIFFGMPNCFTLVATQVPLGISKKD